MKVSEQNLLIEKAKSKKDGVYSYNGNVYAVKNNNLIAFSDYSGNCFSCHGAFNVEIGKVDRFDRKKKLLEFLRRG